MKKTIVDLPKKDIMGVSVRTNNANEMSSKGQIGPLVARYRGENLANDIPHSKEPGVTYVVYTDYASDEFGDYTFLLGEQVFNIEETPNGFKLVTIPAGKYVKFTTNPGRVPDIIIKSWMQIWQMSPEELGGQRTYKADFEVHDKRAVDQEQAVVDIYVGIE